MLYMSNDRKEVFKTEKECLEYEHNIEQERIKREKLELDRQSRLDTINKKYEDLQKEISEYKKDYDARLEGHFTPFHELLDMLYR